MKIKTDDCAPGDNARPSCGFCQTSGNECVYLESATDKLTLDPTTKLMFSRLDEILQSVDGIRSSMHLQGSVGVYQHLPIVGYLTSPVSQPDMNVEPSKDYLRIPSCKASADMVLTWPCFGNRFLSDRLIGTFFNISNAKNSDDSGNSNHFPSAAATNEPVHDTMQLFGGITPLLEERIPMLIDRFLQNVHTKNPILDVEALVQWGKRAAEYGLAWDAQTCLVLLACALGSISCPFVESLCTGNTSENSADQSLYASSASVHAGALQQAESCYLLASRRIGLVKFTVLGAQCHFFAGGMSSFV